MSRAERLLNIVLDVVSSETDVATGKILSRCREMDVVDARWICVVLLRQYGFYTSRISEMMGITPRYVHYILTDFDDRIAVSRIMRNNFERSLKRLGNDLERIV